MERYYSPSKQDLVINKRKGFKEIKLLAEISKKHKEINIIIVFFETKWATEKTQI